MQATLWFLGKDALIFLLLETSKLVLPGLRTPRKLGRRLSNAHLQQITWRWCRNPAGLEILFPTSISMLRGLLCDPREEPAQPASLLQVPMRN